MDTILQILGWGAAALAIMACLGIAGLLVCEGIERLIEAAQEWLE